MGSTPGRSLTVRGGPRSPPFVVSLFSYRSDTMYWTADQRGPTRTNITLQSLSAFSN
jgi:hypothetical protein